MAADETEEELLRSVALKNARSILRARQRAERELIDAKEALDQKTAELGHSLAMMRATLESTTDGILVTDATGAVTDFNQNYITMWRVPTEIIETKDHRRLLEITSRQFKEPEKFLSRSKIFMHSRPQRRSIFWSWLMEDFLSDSQGSSLSRNVTWAGSGAFATSLNGKEPKKSCANSASGSKLPSPASVMR